MYLTGLHIQHFRSLYNVRLELKPLTILIGPNASGKETYTGIAGLNFGWQHYLVAGDEHPVIRWNTELMYRRYEAGDKNDPGAEVLTDYGMFSQFVWRVRERWTAALRGELANGSRNDSLDPFRNRRKRLSLSATHELNRQASLRLQYNRDLALHLPGGSANSIW